MERPSFEVIAAEAAAESQGGEARLDELQDGVGGARAQDDRDAERSLPLGLAPVEAPGGEWQFRRADVSRRATGDGHAAKTSFATFAAVIAFGQPA
jgi:hypothetical protein